MLFVRLLLGLGLVPYFIHIFINSASPNYWFLGSYAILVYFNERQHKTMVRTMSEMIEKMKPYSNIIGAMYKDDGESLSFVMIKKEE